ncbi:MAG TPA: hypothetical protein VNM36_16230 [Gemmatimonadaceae bacterium]|nr:hypothetical protein [Gemmatimonadaceae bacterium]
MAPVHDPDRSVRTSNSAPSIETLAPATGRVSTLANTSTVMRPGGEGGLAVACATARSATIAD